MALGSNGANFFCTSASTRALAASSLNMYLASWKLQVGSVQTQVGMLIQVGLQSLVNKTCVFFPRTAFWKPWADQFFLAQLLQETPQSTKCSLHLCVCFTTLSPLFIRSFQTSSNFAWLSQMLTNTPDVSLCRASAQIPKRRRHERETEKVINLKWL